MAPSFKADGFHCPHCEVYAHQMWFQGAYSKGRYSTNIKGLIVSFCSKCEKYAYWIEEEMIYPLLSIAPYPADDMPDDVKEVFMEARNIINASPRASAALLRLAVQILMPHLGEKGKTINDDIGSLVQKGLPKDVQEALDSIRVIGNNAVHPGQIDLKDDTETAITLFDILNFIVEDRITRFKKVAKIYSKLPASAIKAIEKRNKT